MRTNGPNYPGTYGGGINSLLFQGEKIYAGVYEGGVFVSSNQGASWDSSNIGLKNRYSKTVVSVGSNLFLGTLGGGIFKSTNDGLNWTEVNNGLSNPTVRCIANSGTNIYVGTESGLFLSTTNGEMWIPINSGLSSINIHSLCSYKQNLYAGTSLGVFVSTNYGTDWAALNKGIEDKTINSICVLDSFIFSCSFGYGIYRLTDNGKEWISINSGLPHDPGPYPFQIVPIGKWIVSVIYGWGLFISKDNGEKWVGFNDGLEFQPSVNCLTIKDSIIYLADNYVWKRSLKEFVTSISSTNEISDKYSLEQNYPNPFNPNTTINYYLPTDNFVNIKVFGLLGEEVANLISGSQNAGWHNVTFSGNNIPSGIYFYRLSAGHYSCTKKLILLK